MIHADQNSIRNWCITLAAIAGAGKVVWEWAKWVRAKINTELAKRAAFNSLVDVAPALLKIVAKFDAFERNLAENTNTTLAIKNDQVEMKNDQKTMQDKLDRVLSHEHHNAANVEEIAKQMKSHHPE